MLSRSSDSRTPARTTTSVAYRSATSNDNAMTVSTAGARIASKDAIIGGHWLAVCSTTASASASLFGKYE
jgi:hypothetical protein